MKKCNLYIKAVKFIAVLFFVFIVFCAIASILQGLLSIGMPKPIQEHVYTINGEHTDKTLCCAKVGMTTEGTILLKDPCDDSSREVTTIYDKSYNLLWEGTGDIPLEYETVKSEQDNWSFNAVERLVNSELSPEMKSNFIIQKKLPNGAKEYWKYNRSGYFEGFLNRSRIGYIDEKGFSLANPASKGLEKFMPIMAYTGKNEDDAPKLIFTSNENLYEIDVNSREIVLIRENVKDAKIGIFNWFDKNDKKEYVGAILLNAPQTNPVLIFRDGFKALEISNMEDVERVDLSFASAWDIKPESEYKNYIIAKDIEQQTNLLSCFVGMGCSSELTNQDKPQIYALYGIDSSGSAKLINKHQVSLIRKETKIANQAQIDAYLSKSQFVKDFLPVISYYGEKFLLYLSQANKDIPESSISDFFKSIKPNNLLYGWLWGAFCALLVYLHNRNRCTSSAILFGWVVFALLFNVMGLLVCLTLTHYTVVKCNNCGKKRHLLKENCLHCGKPMLEPLPQSTDIFH